jgi:hypothetical protein
MVALVQMPLQVELTVGGPRRRPRLSRAGRLRRQRGTGERNSQHDGKSYLSRQSAEGATADVSAHGSSRNRLHYLAIFRA